MASDRDDNVSSNKKGTDSEWEDDDIAVSSGPDEEADTGVQTHRENTTLVFQCAGIRQRPMHSELTPRLPGKEVNRVLSVEEVRQEILEELDEETKTAMLVERETQKYPEPRHNPKDESVSEEREENFFSERRYMGDFLGT